MCAEYQGKTTLRMPTHNCFTPVCSVSEGSSKLFRQNSNNRCACNAYRAEVKCLHAKPRTVQSFTLPVHPVCVFCLGEYVSENGNVVDKGGGTSLGGVIYIYTYIVVYIYIYVCVSFSFAYPVA